MIDPIVEALDGFVPAFHSARGDWQGILSAASSPVPTEIADREPVARRRARGRALFARRAVQVAIAIAVLAMITTGIAWAAGAFKITPRALFESNPQGQLNAAAGMRGIWTQKVIPDSVKEVATVHIPKVGPVAFWYGRASKGGWCGGLRLRNGDWLGTPQAHFLHLGPGGRSIGIGGGVVPGCFATEEQIRGGPSLTKFECTENAIQANSVGELWEIRYGLVNAPGAITVRDLTTGRSTPVVDGKFFLLAVRHAHHQQLRLRLVAYDKAGNVVAHGGHVPFGC